MDSYLGRCGTSELHLPGYNDMTDQTTQENTDRSKNAYLTEKKKCGPCGHYLYSGSRRLRKFHCRGDPLRRQFVSVSRSSLLTKARLVPPVRQLFPLEDQPHNEARLLILESTVMRFREMTKPFKGPLESSGNRLFKRQKYSSYSY